LSAEPVRLAVLGDPLRFTLSPELHRAGALALGLHAVSEALPTPVAELGRRLRSLANQGYRGVNVTIPLKEPALEHLARVSDEARRARSVNTIGFDVGGWWGETTDGGGFLDLLATFGRTPSLERAVLLGAGGAARSVALALIGAGCDEVHAVARDPARAAGAWHQLAGGALVTWGSDEARERLANATLVVNATPLEDDGERALPLVEVARDAVLIDLRYQRELTSWVRRARSAGREAYDGLGLLVFQARRALALWTGRLAPVQPMASAVGWPR
jgi:shikimate dehydrogenase